MSILTEFRVTDEQKRKYQEEGFFILDKVIPDRNLEILRSECAELIRLQDEEMDRQKTDTLNLSRKNSRYFVFLAYKDRPELGQFIFSGLMAEICRATIGPNAMLFWEQFVVKGTDKKGAEFGWHQDSGYVDYQHKPYVNAWIPLDDVNEENGTVYLLPYSLAGTRDKVEHKPVPNSNDRVGYFGTERGTPAICPAGSIVVFSSTVFHRSGANFTDRMRRAYAIQYSPEPIYEADGSLKGLAEPFLADNKRVR
ncbi:MAG: phytanoyl-CoA dioxygenase family protein [Ignavibacteria bacterium]|jgi:ectoine hydroxylase-related dioxygenase (phytanoyl-CoA dioxygenase family)|nr:phytanoyl-CoA dioxygenase family protein [Ignavibacteria bacterium]MCU7500667.1 phytanoyl-CoA dioxygenase family protein [Ignavibacteria bacterium]MCU7512807.1 phytanoyl-CoA dioxygenase family protein [Ignavibacteria bacterium]MCU7521782.1 phytanoyl-CoA dioxygenase family protein [Ignavibacteria bacterium]MCU7524831.1 phytanoyl-CoA dioxygenase family protein [Ignavibacteria bacterium]